MGEPKVHCIICEELCHKAPTKRGWTHLKYNSGIHFDCVLNIAWGAVRVCQTEQTPIPNKLFAEALRDSAALKVLNELAKSEWGLKIVVAEKDAMISVYTAEDELPTTISVAPTFREAIEKAIANKEGVRTLVR